MVFYKIWCLIHVSYFQIYIFCVCYLYSLRSWCQISLFCKCRHNHFISRIQRPFIYAAKWESNNGESSCSTTQNVWLLLFMKLKIYEVYGNCNLLSNQARSYANKVSSWMIWRGMWKISWCSATKFLSWLACALWYVSQELNLKAECRANPVYFKISPSKLSTGVACCCCWFQPMIACCKLSTRNGQDCLLLLISAHDCRMQCGCGGFLSMYQVFALW